MRDERAAVPAIGEMPLGHPDEWQPPPIAEALDWQKQSQVFEEIALTSGTESSVLAGAGGPEPVRIQDVTAVFRPTERKTCPRPNLCSRRTAGTHAGTSQVVISDSFLEAASQRPRGD